MLDGVRTADRGLQLAFLDEQRSIVAGKLRGLTGQQATQVAMPTGTTLLGLIRHLTSVEQEWFQQIVAGCDVDLPDDGDEWFTTADESVEAVLEAYEAACGESRRIVDERSLDEVSAGAHPYFGRCEVGWVVLHMIRETARHAGHADILRELTDGATGYA